MVNKSRQAGDSDHLLERGAATKCYVTMQASARALDAAREAIRCGASDFQMFGTFFAEQARALGEESFIQDQLEQFHRRVPYIEKHGVYVRD
jgi:hypothetical protein